MLIAWRPCNSLLYFVVLDYEVHCVLYDYASVFSELLEDVDFESKTDSLIICFMWTTLSPMTKSFGFGVLRHFYAFVCFQVCHTIMQVFSSG